MNENRVSCDLSAEPASPGVDRYRPLGFRSITVPVWGLCRSMTIWTGTDWTQTVTSHGCPWLYGLVPQGLIAVPLTYREKRCYILPRIIEKLTFLSSPPMIFKI